VAGIDDDQRPGIAAAFGLHRRFRLAALRPSSFEREAAHETLAVGRGDVEHETGRLVMDRIEHEGHVHLRRTGEIDDHARAALHHQAKTECFDQATPRLPDLGRKLERDLRHVHHHPVGVGEGEGADVDLAAQIDDQPGLRIVAAEPHVARDREIVRRPGRRDGFAGALGRGRDAQGRYAEEKSRDRRTHKHGLPAPARPSYSITGVQLTQT
jgi:hypothetical protein